VKSRRFLLLALPLTLLVGLDAGPAHADNHAPGFRCGTPAILQQQLPQLRAIPRPAKVHTFGGTKLTRDPFGTHTTRTSANFAVHTGNNPITDAQAASALAIAEESWAVYSDGLGFGPITGTDAYRLNVYISWDNDSPDIDYDGGYATIDNQGYPYLVISKNLVTDLESLKTVISHELFHDYQMSLNAYNSAKAQWYWEATAEWGAMEVYPALSGPYSFVGAVALTQELPLFYFGDPFADNPTGQHQYGSGLFTRYLSDRVGLPNLITDSWNDGGGNDDPIRVLDDHLPQGAIEGGIEAAIVDYNARNALWDYPQRALMLGWIASFEATYPTYEQLAAPLFLSAGTEGFVDPAPARHLRELGAHQFVLSAPASKVIEVEIQGEAAGSGGTPATWAATLIRTSDDGIVYTPVPFTGTDGELTVTLPDGEGSARLMVTVLGNGRSETETFAYQLRIGPDPEGTPEAGVGGADAGDNPEEGDGPGCCSTGGGAGGSLGLSLLVAGLIGVRRRTRRSRG
jgi:hypothetical protein